MRRAAAVLVLLAVGAVATVAVAWLRAARPERAPRWTVGPAEWSGGVPPFFPAVGTPGIEFQGFVSTIMGETTTHVSAYIDGDRAAFQQHSWTFGWPWRALRADEFGEVDRRGVYEVVVYHHENAWCGGIRLDAPNPRRQGYHGRRLPVRPMLWGFLANTAVYAAVFGGAAAGVLVMRRRRESGCQACGYPVGVSPVCTECGEPVEPAGPPA